ncbi:MAG: hypothetical protein RLZZ156_2613 [Deinococcota bacterium]|jgi:type I restriction enzyme, S subunit
MTQTETQPDFFAVLTGAQATTAPALQELPMNWEWAKLEDVGEITTGNTPTPKDAENYGDDYPLVKPSDLNTLIPISKTEQFLSNEGAKKARILRTGAVLVSCIGNLGKVGIAGVQLATNQQINAIEFYSEFLLDKYGYYYCKTLAPWLTANSSATTITIINKSRFSTAPIPIPPLLEQKRIVAKLEELLSELEFGVKTLKIALAKVKKYRQSVLKAAVQGDLSKAWREAQGGSLEPASVLLKKVLLERQQKWILEQQAKGRKNAKYTEPQAPDSSGLAELPEGWVWATADQLTSVVTDGEHITPPRTDSGVFLLSARNVLNGKLALKDVDYISEKTHLELNKRLTIKAGDVLLSCSGTVGRSCVVPENISFSLVRSVAVLKPVLKMSEFLSFCIRSPLLQNQIETRKTQTAQANIFQGKIRVLVFPLPPLEEQAFIVSQVEAKLSATDHLEQSIKANLLRAERLRASTLNMAFRGELVPQDATDEPAAVLLERIRGLRTAGGRQKKL